MHQMLVCRIDDRVCTRCCDISMLHCKQEAPASGGMLVLMPGEACPQSVQLIWPDHAKTRTDSFPLEGTVLHRESRPEMRTQWRPLRASSAWPPWNVRET
jgi:hypothetical protein